MPSPVAPTPPSALIGRTLADGRYRLVRELGAGAMGTVYEGVHEALGRKVAIKLLNPEMMQRPRYAERFRREARAASLLHHRNSVQLLDFGDDGALFYLVMEYLEGPTLAALLDAEAVLSPTRAIALVAQVCAGLGAAHDQGVVHRDIKPTNIVLTPGIDDDGDPVELVKVLDFGIAKIQAQDADGVPVSSTLTLEGDVCGTPEYMSPEQAEGRRVDARSDVYACGVLLFRMLAGAVPFSGDTPFGTMIKHVTAPVPSLAGLCPLVSAELEAVVQRCLAKSPDGRFPTVRALRAALLALPEAAGGRAAERAGLADTAAAFAAVADTGAALPAVDGLADTGAALPVVALPGGADTAAALPAVDGLADTGAALPLVALPVVPETVTEVPPSLAAAEPDAPAASPAAAEVDVPAAVASSDVPSAALSAVAEPDVPPGVASSEAPSAAPGEAYTTAVDLTRSAVVTPRPPGVWRAWAIGAGGALVAALVAWQALTPAAADPAADGAAGIEAVTPRPRTNRPKTPKTGRVTTPAPTATPDADVIAGASDVIEAAPDASHGSADTAAAAAIADTGGAVEDVAGRPVAPEPGRTPPAAGAGGGPEGAPGAGSPTAGGTESSSSASGPTSAPAVSPVPAPR